MHDFEYIVLLILAWMGWIVLTKPPPAPIAPLTESAAKVEK